MVEEEGVNRRLGKDESWTGKHLLTGGNDTEYAGISLPADRIFCQANHPAVHGVSMPVLAARIR